MRRSLSCKNRTTVGAWSANSANKRGSSDSKSLLLSQLGFSILSSSGGLVAFYQGVRHILMPQPIVSPAISLGVLVVSALFEGWSFGVGFREYKRVIRGRDIPLWSFIKASKDPSLYGTLLEDFSAVIGIAIAALGVIASSMLHIGWADGAASIAIGLLLVGVSAVLANETRSLIAGEAVAGPIMEELHRVLAADSRILQIDEIATMHLGPQV